MKPQGPDRVVVRRRRAPAPAAHGGSWKIAYADFVTAMMAFFLVMWLIALVPSKDLKTIAAYFRMPLMTAVTGGPKVESGQTVIPGGSPSIVPNDNSLPPSLDDKHASKGDDAEIEKEAERLAQKLVERRLAEMRAEQPAERPAEGLEVRAERLAEKRDTERLEDLKGDLDSLIESDPVLKEFRPQLLLDMTPDGLRIQIVDKQNRPMFATGSARMQPYMSAILRELAPAFNDIPNSLSIAGHTDARQYAAGEREYSNWELSADRANAARRELVAGGLQVSKIKRVLGLAASVSLIKDDPDAAVNRRISIVVLNRRAERRIDAQASAGVSAERLRRVLETPQPPDGPLAGSPAAGGGQGAAGKPAAGKPAAGTPAAAESAADKSGADKSAAGNSAASGPAAGGPAAAPGRAAKGM
jgi:chemotaxis protein MotB